ncbi:DUF1294 domain-containing protein [Pseudoalteromonas sp. T1lg23B]|uniref:DUF1294 domain-containing protein n=1 Tax=Pseudoalteromonas sp. T1lg23B TaxID=2077097 RepID=UPI001319BFB0|nr:DUF1294 domain-containing protein [Pseudoalteromonas sp. T1lg23B]
MCTWLLIAVLTVCFSHSDIRYALGIVTYLVIFNALFLLLFWVDKQRAISASRRVSEAKLLAISWLAGNMTMFIAQKSFRHKCQKWQFNAKLLLLSFAQTAGLFWLSYELLIQ